MNIVYINWLFNELKVLVQKGIITKDVADKISSYYKNEYELQVSENQMQVTVEKSDKNISSEKSIYKEINSRNRTSAKKNYRIRAEHIPMILSLIAAVLISAGVISLIAYNWNAIPRTVKAAVAFALLLITQGAGCYVFFKKSYFSKIYCRELTSVLWSLLFGGLVAFVSQICRLPGNAAGFAFIWSVSSVLLTYAFRSTATFVIALMQSCAYVFLSRSLGGTVGGFYLLFASLVPFAWSSRYGMRLSLAVAALMIGFLIEKGIPGLWIVCSVSFAVLSLELGIIRKDRFIKYFSAAGLCILLQILSSNSLWHNIGWQNFRLYCSHAGSVLDVLLAACLTGGAVAIPVMPILLGKKSVSYKLIYPMCALVITALYVAYSCMPPAFQQKSFLAPTVIVFLFAALFFLHVIYSRLSFSWMLLLFVVTSASMAQFRYMIFSIPALLIMTESLCKYRKTCSGYIRILCVAALIFAARASAYYTLECSVPACMLGIRFMMYALIFLASVTLIVRAKCFRQSFDVIFVCMAIAITGIAFCIFKVNEDALRLTFLCILILACAYDFTLFHYEKKSGIQWYWMPFAALIIYFLCSGFISSVSVIPLALFILLAESAAGYRMKQMEKEGKAVYAFVRVMISLLVYSVIEKLVPVTDTSSTSSIAFMTASYCCYAAVSAVLLVMSKRIKESLDVLLLVIVLIIRGVFSSDKNLSGFSEILLYAAAICASVYGFLRWRFNGRLSYLPYVLLIVLLQLSLPFYFYDGNISVIIAVPLCTCIYLYIEEQSNAKNSALPAICEIACAVMIFFAAFFEMRKDGIPDFSYIIFSVFGTLLYAAFTLTPFVSLVRKKKKFNMIIVLYSLILFAALIVTEISAMNVNLYNAFLSEKMFNILKLLSFISIFFISGYYIVNAYRTGKLATANVAGIYAALAICIKFFTDDYSFVAKGILFIVLGLAMLLLNMLLLRFGEKSVEGGE
ncbi:MAG: DUF2157 domain-containing protein [Treponema sp.]|nr:DUF2157 domain-containing protein [Treponema sp.]